MMEEIAMEDVAWNQAYVLMYKYFNERYLNIRQTVEARRETKTRRRMEGSTSRLPVARMVRYEVSVVPQGQ